jgi:hypothetical protein
MVSFSALAQSLVPLWQDLWQKHHVEWTGVVVLAVDEERCIVSPARSKKCDSANMSLHNSCLAFALLPGQPNKLASMFLVNSYPSSMYSFPTNRAGLLGQTTSDQLPESSL